MQAKTNATATALVLLLATTGCDDDPAKGEVPWGDQRLRVIAADRSAATLDARENDDACVSYENQCYVVTCEDAADIIVDADGNLLDFLCYPGEADLTVEQIAAQSGEVLQRQNNSVIVLDDVADGPDLEGDVTIDANNVVLYAEDPNGSVIGGSLTLDGNNLIVRGVRVQGDVTVLKNNVTLAVAVLEGDLDVRANNVQILATDVLGNVTISGNNVKVLGNRVVGSLSVTGSGGECSNNFVADDANGDRIIAETELRGPLACR